MNFISSLNPILIGTAIIAIIQPQVAVALTREEISAKAEQITVRIDGKDDNSSGSGVIIERNGDTYVVITNYHVIQNVSVSYKVQTSDGKQYPVNYSQVRRIPRVDLAILQFTSSQNYQKAEIGNSDEIKIGSQVYATGFPVPGPGNSKRDYLFLSGLISGRNSGAKNGYELAHGINSISGMSGGPIFNEQGLLIGIYGASSVDPRTGSATFGLGIPINIYKKFALSAQPVVTGSQSTSSPKSINICNTQISLEEAVKQRCRI
ncbi:MAG: trypsin-like peptidase domain-containing protein [Richelia sp. RM2_1_2]|nr:trypsin-like peptidase domain-containing protein [Richelia sp. SM2_1_7]NJN11369.1 trypsin-like peptidase domain-containing protein [Richelia sp. RM1_1_1]NJO63104.1 trypsin-like peptidase domain-containing protein [Richelia sp. RM2_1_2]